MFKFLSVNEIGKSHSGIHDPIPLSHLLSHLNLTHMVALEHNISRTNCQYTIDRNNEKKEKMVPVTMDETAFSMNETLESAYESADLSRAQNKRNGWWVTFSIAQLLQLTFVRHMPGSTEIWEQEILSHPFTFIYPELYLIV